MRYLLCFLLLGSAVGQTHSMPNAVAKSGDVALSKAYCDGVISMGASFKSIHDIFPSECEIKAATPAPDVPAIQEPANSTWIAMTQDSFGCDRNGHMDPAQSNNGIQVGFPKCVGGWSWTCADKSRILEIAENGEAWCHKPQTK